MAGLTELLQEWLGWCPYADMAKARHRYDDRAGFRTAGMPDQTRDDSGSDRPADPEDLRYEHTQPGFLLMAVVGGSCLILLLTLVISGPSPVPLIVSGMMIFILAIMSRLTVSVTREALRIRFGPVGLVHREWKLSGIVSAVPVTNPWYYGYGLRWTPYGRLYNVSGRHAVEILCISGDRVRIGTDEPEALAKVINHAIR